VGRDVGVPSLNSASLVMQPALKPGYLMILSFTPLKKHLGSLTNMVVRRMYGSKRAKGAGRWSCESFMNCTRPQVIEGGRIKRRMWAEHIARMRRTKLV
jgi:hypothetical protein